ncbi:MAG: hypothetical protein A2099_03910 [Planctomycetes bacterium GWF2_39_10]|nr:MAG: hypothetical protein A2099_03910 [Planctomycetes bacterium GWF2_39_10]
MNKYIIPHIQIRKKNLSQSREKSPESEPNPAFLPEELSQKEEYTFETINIQEIACSEQDYIIVGESGIGKTSLLLWMGKQIALEGEKAKYIPLFIQMNDVSQIKMRDEFLSLLNTRYNLDEYDIKDRRFLFLVDGLDQIGEFGNIQNRLKNKDIFGERNKIILTTRPIGYEWVKKNLENRYEYLQIQPFDKKKIQEYIGRYVNDERFQTILSQNNELLKVPILLKMVKALISTDRLSEIRNRASLYEEFIRCLFEDWESAKKGCSSAYTTAIEIQKDLAELSFHAIENNYLGSFPLGKGYEYLKNDKKRLDEIISWSVTHNLIEKERQKVIAYTHQSFQEYFAAAYLKDKLCRDNRIDQEILEQCLEYKRWDETIVFTVGMLDDEMAKTLIEKIVKCDLYLAGLCLGEFKGQRSGFKGLINELLKNLEKEEAQNVLIKIADSDLIEKLIKLLTDTDSNVRRNAANALGKIGTEKAVDPLIAVLKDKDTDRNVRQSVADALGKIGTEKAIDPLIAVLNDEDMDWEVRQSTASVLCKIGKEKAIDILIAVLKDRDMDEDARQRAAYTLSEIGTKKAIDALIAVLNDKDMGWGVRRSAADALGKIGTEKAVDALIAVLKDRGWDDPQRWRFRQSVADALGKIGTEKAIDTLIAVLNDKDMDWEARQNAASVLCKIGKEKAIDILIAVLKDRDMDRDRDFRQRAAYALSEIGTKKAIDALIAVLKDEDRNVRLIAAYTVGKIGMEKAVDPLFAVLKDEDRDMNIRGRAANVLGKIGTEKAIDTLIAVLNDEDMYDEYKYVRGSAANALCEIFEKLKEVKQDTLFARIYSLKFDNELKNFLIARIKDVTSRRFIKITFQNKNL